uniref:Uncharacterized protein n=1 Tax=Nymphaea colorata TaxID=210225 RepID=A0A5K1GRE7_9MAGN
MYIKRSTYLYDRVTGNNGDDVRTGNYVAAAGCGELALDGIDHLIPSNRIDVGRCRLLSVVTIQKDASITALNVDI